MNRPDSELARLVAHVFQSLGRRRIGEDDWVRVLSLDRNWFPPSRARLLAARARDASLLRNAGERDFEMGLEAEGITLPLAYRPDALLLEAAAQSGSTSGTPEPALPLFRRIVRAAAARLGQSEAEVVGRVNAVQAASGGLLRAEVAALVFAGLHGVDPAPYLDEAEAALRA